MNWTLVPVSLGVTMPLALMRVVLMLLPEVITFRAPVPFPVVPVPRELTHRLLLSRALEHRQLELPVALRFPQDRILNQAQLQAAVVMDRRLVPKEVLHRPVAVVLVQVRPVDLRHQVRVLIQAQ